MLPGFSYFESDRSRFAEIFARRGALIFFKRRAPSMRASAPMAGPRALRTLNYESSISLSLLANRLPARLSSSNEMLVLKSSFLALRAVLSAINMI